MTERALTPGIIKQLQEIHDIYRDGDLMLANIDRPLTDYLPQHRAAIAAAIAQARAEQPRPWWKFWGS